MKKFIEFILIAFPFVFLMYPLHFLAPIFELQSIIWVNYVTNRVIFSILSIFILNIISSCTYYILFRKVSIALLFTTFLSGTISFFYTIMRVNHSNLIGMIPTISLFLLGTIILFGSKFNLNFMKIYLGNLSSELNGKLYKLTDVGVRRVTLECGLFFYFFAGYFEIIEFFQIGIPYVIGSCICFIFIIRLYNYYYKETILLNSIYFYPVTEPE